MAQLMAEQARWKDQQSANKIKDGKVDLKPDERTNSKYALYLLSDKSFFLWLNTDFVCKSSFRAKIPGNRSSLWVNELETSRYNTELIASDLLSWNLEFQSSRDQSSASFSEMTFRQRCMLSNGLNSAISKRCSWLLLETTYVPIVFLCNFRVFTDSAGTILRFFQVFSG